MKDFDLIFSEPQHLHLGFHFLTWRESNFTLKVDQIFDHQLTLAELVSSTIK